MFKTGDQQEGSSFLVSKLLNGDPAKWLHPFHTRNFNAYLALIGTCRELGDYDGSAYYAKLVIQGLEQVDLHHPPELYDAYYSLGEAYVCLAAKRDQRIGDLLSGKLDQSKTVGKLTDEAIDQMSSTDTPILEEAMEKEEEKPEEGGQKKGKRQINKEIEKLHDEKEHWLRLALMAYQKCLTGRVICYGANYDLTKAAQNRVNELSGKKEGKKEGSSSQTKGSGKGGRRRKK